MPTRQRRGAGGRPFKGRPSSGTVLVFVVFVMVLLFVFAIVAGRTGLTTLSIAAGTAAITLAGDVVRRLLTFVRDDDDESDSPSVAAPPASTVAVQSPETKGGTDARTA
ncbi:hypothetical protein AB0J72_46835 [Dactylosporangium sp. NPDC049742]|uniref:hypothetical protein n=1 Tax=Dactylosporangium sp. NPDC049742 TaxID=3154737 RepID=UPI003419A4CD